MSFNIGWFSCMNLGAPLTAGDHIVDTYSCTAVFSLGDTPYMGEATGWGGVSLATIDKDSSVADILEKHTNLRTTPQWAKMENNLTLYYMADDHEWGGDNWDHTIAQANTDLNIGATTQAEVDTHFDRCNQAIISVSTNNPANTDADAIAEKPSESAEADASIYPIKYFRVGYDINGNVDNTNPHIEFFVIDCISYRSPYHDADDAAKKMLGDNQRGWLTAHLNSSTATFKAIMTPKKTHINAGVDNGDTWGAYTTEREVILDYIDDNSITGVIWLAGDRHTPMIDILETPVDAHDHVCVCACPVSVAINTPKATIIDAQTRWFDENNRVFGLLSVEQTYIEASVCSVTSGAKLWTGRVEAGSNALSYPDKVLAVSSSISEYY